MPYDHTFKRPKETRTFEVTFQRPGPGTHLEARTFVEAADESEAEKIAMIVRDSLWPSFWANSWISEIGEGESVYCIRYEDERALKAHVVEDGKLVNEDWTTEERIAQHEAEVKLLRECLADLAPLAEEQAAAESVGD